MQLKVSKKRTIIEQVAIEVENLQFDFTKDKTFDKVKCYACGKNIGQERPFGIVWITKEWRSGRLCLKCAKSIAITPDDSGRFCEEDLSNFLE